MCSAFSEKLLLTTALASVLAMSAHAQFAQTTQIGGGALGSITTNSPGSYTVVGGGNDIWAASDEFTFHYSEIAGDFDVAVRVESLEPLNRWTKAGLMVRESATGSSRMLFPRVTPSGATLAPADNPVGADDSRLGFRTGRAENGSNGGENEAGTGSPNYPAAWLRLQRTGSTFTGYNGTDGVNWNSLGVLDTTTWQVNGVDIPFADVALVGFAVSRHSGPNPTATAEFRDYSNSADTVAVSFLVSPADDSGPTGGTISLSSLAAGRQDVMVYQWRKDGEDILGANSRNYTTPPLAVLDDGAVYTVFASNTLNGTSAESTAATISVFDAPVLVSVDGRNNPAGVHLTFDKPMGASATNPANYTVSGGVTVSGAAYAESSNVIVLTLSPLTLGTTYTVEATGVQDANGNTVTPNPAIGNFSYGGNVSGPQGLTVKRYNGGNAGGLLGLMNSVICTTPTYVDTSVPTMEYGTNPAYNAGGAGNTENYGAWIYGWFVPRVTGEYRFGLSSDDGSALFLSTDEQPANRVLLAAQFAWNGGRLFYDVRSPWQPDPVFLEAGKHYYMEVFLVEGGGGDHVTVAMQAPGQPPIANGSTGIPRDYFATNYVLGCPPQAGFSTLGAVTVAAQPGNTVVTEGEWVDWTVQADGTPLYTYQWYSNSVAIAGATSKTLRFRAPISANSASYTVEVRNGFSSTTTTPWTLTVNADSTAPTIVSAVGSAPPFDKVTLTFSEALAETAAETFSNYTITNSSGTALAVTEAVLVSENEVELTTAAQTGGERYTVVVNGVTDLAATPNAIVGNSTASFTGWIFTPGFVRMDVWRRETLQPVTGVSNLTSLAAFPDDPTYRHFLRSTDSREVYPGGGDPNPDASRNNYGARIWGWFVAPGDGTYTLALNNDDDARLSASPDENPDNAVTLLDAICCRGDTDFSQTTTTPPLTAGNRYYMEVLYQEGIGGDYARLAASGPEIETMGIIGRTNIGIYANPDTAGVISIVQQPGNQIHTANEFAVFNVVATNSAGLPQHYQWTENGVPIPGAVNSSLTLGPLTLEDSGNYYGVTVYVPGASVTSSFGTNTVQDDVVAPTIVAVTTDSTLRRIYITYSELMFSNSTAEAISYQFTDGTILNIDTVELNNGSNAVVNLSGPMEPGTTYELNINGPTDLAGLSLEDTNVVFTTWALTRGFAQYDFWLNLNGGVVNDLLNSPRYPVDTQPENHVTYFTNNVNWPGGIDNYALRMLFYFVPTVTGDYQFTARYDDGMRVRMDVDGSGNLTTILDAACCQGALGTTVSSVISLQAGQRYAVEAIVKEAGGGDYLGLGVRRPGESLYTFVSPGEIFLIADPSLNVVGDFAQQPASTTRTVNSTATFTVVFTNAPGFSPYLQWQRKGPSDAEFVDINGANGSSYTTPLLSLADSGTEFRVLGNLPGNTSISGIATLTVVEDETPPTLVSASVTPNRLQVGVCFSEIMDEGSVEETTAYTIDGANPSTAVLRADGKSVLLTFAEQVPAQFTLQVEAVRDLSQNELVSASADGSVWLDNIVDIGGVLPAGEVFTCEDGSIEIKAGGADVWGTGNDQFTFAYVEKSGDFDVKVRVDRLDYVGNSWSKAGLNIRDGTDNNNRMVWFYPTPTSGANAFEGGLRPDPGAAIVDIGFPRPTVYYPAYLRLKREGTTFQMYLSPDGVNWNTFGSLQTLPQFPETLLVGMGVVSHIQGTPTTAVFSQFGDLVSQSVLTITREGNNVVIRWEGDGVLEYTDEFPADWIELPSATSPYTIEATEDERYFRLRQSP